MPAEPLRRVPDFLSRDDVLLLREIAVEGEDSECLEWCSRALQGDSEALAFLREELALAREDEISERRAEIRWRNAQMPAAVYEQSQMANNEVMQTLRGVINFHQAELGRLKPYSPEWLCHRAQMWTVTWVADLHSHASPGAAVQEYIGYLDKLNHPQ